MFLESAHIRMNLVLIAALTVFVKDLGGRGGGVQAWTYHYSSRMKWEEGNIWCKTHFTGLVVIHNKEETAFINELVPFNRRYYWIGVKRVNEVWTWADTNKTVPLEAQNWAFEEPDDITGQDCVEIYIKRDNDTAKWNNEKCYHRKAALCYRDSCMPDSCSVHADCIETVGNYTCQCHPGFMGPRCQEAVPCPVLKETLRGGRVNCSHPFAPHSYNSTCEVGCNEGYELHGNDLLRCDHTGQWTAGLPTCEVKQCSPMFFPVTGSMTCVDAVKPFSFGSQCDFTCQEGYRLTGNDTLTCQASGNWSEPPPTCTVVQCNRLKSPSHASMQCRGPLGEHSYGSMCALQCDEGFELFGEKITACSASGRWSHSLPVCRAKKCPALNSPPHGSLVCTGPHGSFSFNSTCVSTCDEGFFLNGTANTECTSSGSWSTDVPQCLAKKCSALNPPPHGFINCTDPHGSFSFGSKCVSSCESGFLLNGSADTECTAQATWSRETSHCLARPCPLLAKPPHYGNMTCSHPYSHSSYGSHCDFECEEGFWLTGTSSVLCNATGHWSENLPTCQPVQCKAIPASSLNLSMNCSHPLGNFSFGSQCLFSCEEGLSLNGPDVLFCLSSGVWNNSLPTCKAEGLPLGSAMLLYTGVGAASAVVPLVSIGLALLVMKRLRKSGNSMLTEEHAWDDNVNPAFES